MGGKSAVVEEEAAVGRYPWEKSAVAESFALQTGGRSGADDAFEFVITDADGNERVLGHRAWNTFYKQKHKPVSTNPNLQAVVAARSSMLSRATRGDWDSRLITMPMVLARAIAERKATMQQNLQLQRFIQKRALKLGQNYNKMFVCNKANNAQVLRIALLTTQSLLPSHYPPSDGNVIVARASARSQCVNIYKIKLSLPLRACCAHMRLGSNGATLRYNIF
jgi:hypothetical protein